MLYADEAINTLNKAGLTIIQARVYLALVKKGKRDIKSLSKDCNIDRSNAYKAITDLQEFGLVKKLLGKPNYYEAIEPELGISLLLKKKTDEFQDICEKASNLSKKLALTVVQHSENEYVSIMPPEFKSSNWIKKTFPHIQRKVDLLFYEKREAYDMSAFDRYPKMFSKGGRVRWIFNRSTYEDNEFTLRIRQFNNLLKYPNPEVKYTFIDAKPMGIIDDKFVFFFIDQGKPLKESRKLFTNNVNLLSVAQTYFEKIWSESKELKDFHSV
jgi:predicted transcriptional regulator